MGSPQKQQWLRTPHGAAWAVSTKQSTAAECSPYLGGRDLALHYCSHLGITAIVCYMSLAHIPSPLGHTKSLR
jgi:hypothetical protein